MEFSEQGKASSLGGRSSADPVEPLASLQAQLQEAQEQLRAIRTGEIDALLLQGRDGARFYTRQGSDQAYRLLVQAINEGAVMLDRQGGITYANRAFAALLGRPLEEVLGGHLNVPAGNALGVVVYVNWQVKLTYMAAGARWALASSATAPARVRRHSFLLSWWRRDSQGLDQCNSLGFWRQIGGNHSLYFLGLATKPNHHQSCLISLSPGPTGNRPILLQRKDTLKAKRVSVSERQCC